MDMSAASILGGYSVEIGELRDSRSAGVTLRQWLNEIFHVDSGRAVAGVVVVSSAAIAIARRFVEADGRGIFDVDVKPHLDGALGVGGAFEAAEEFGTDAAAAVTAGSTSMVAMYATMPATCWSPLDDGEAGHVAVLLRRSRSRHPVSATSWRM